MKIQTGEIITDMRGRAGGSVIGKNRFGLTFYNWRKPVNHQPDYMQLSRINFGYISNFWKSLDDTARGTWNTGAETILFTDRFGNEYHPTGFELFMSSNQRAWPTLLDIIDELETLDYAPVVPSYTVEWYPTIPALNINLSETWEQTDGAIICFASKGYSAGRIEPTVKYRLIHYEINSTINFLNLGTYYEEIFGIQKPNTRVFVKLVALNRYNGFGSTPTLANNLPT